MLDKLTTLLENVTTPLEKIANFIDYLFHPSKILIAFWNWTVELSYIVCLFACITSMLLYLGGNKKFAKYVPGSVIVYTLIRAINSVI